MKGMFIKRMLMRGGIALLLSIFSASNAFAETAAPPAATNEAEAMEAAMKQHGIELLHREFNFQYQNDAQMDAFILQQIKTYYAKIRNCEPGIYKVALPSFGLVINHVAIQGFKNDKCVVDSYYLMDTQKVESKCQYDRANLSVFSDEEASSLMKGSYSYDSQHLTPFQKVQKENCKVYSNGVEVSLLTKRPSHVPS